MAKKSTIIGSGFGGLAAALRLKAKGHKVTLWPLALNLSAAASPPKPEPITVVFFAIFLWPILTRFFLKC